MTRLHNDDVIVTTDLFVCPLLYTSQVHHREFPEMRAEGATAREGATLLLWQMERAKDGTSDAWHREVLEHAIDDVRAFLQELGSAGELDTRRFEMTAGRH